MKILRSFLILVLAIGLAIFLATCNDGGDDDSDDDTENLPEAPSDLRAIEVNKYRATLRWTDNSEVEDGFIVERRGETQDWRQIADLPVNTTSYADTGLDCETGYEYRVKAYNDFGNSEYSNVASVITLECWTIQTLDFLREVGLYTSIAIDSSNKVHISYYEEMPDYNLRYATNVSGRWQSVIVDSFEDVGTYTSIAVDSNDNVHISYFYCGVSYYCDARDLKYATNSSGDWQVFTIDEVGSVGYYTSLAIDSSNKVHISYYDKTNNDLKYATNSSGSWQTFTIDSDGDLGSYTSIAIDSNDKVHISYIDWGNEDLKYATSSSGSWQTFTIGSVSFIDENTSIAVDSSDKVHISYCGTDEDLKYATNASGSWQSFLIDTDDIVGGWPSIAIDSNDKVHISYYYCGEWEGGCTVGFLKYATNSKGAWQSFIIDTRANVGEYTSIAIDSNDKVHISYYECGKLIIGTCTRANLKYATNAEVE